MSFINSCSFDSLNDQSPKCEVVHETKLTSKISCPNLAQSVEHQSDDQKVLGSISTRYDFQFCSSPCRILLEFEINRRIMEQLDYVARKIKITVCVK